VTEKIVAVPTLEDLLEQSAATEAFAQALRAYEAGASSDLIVTNAGAPPVKVLRVLCQLLASEPALPVDRVIVEGRSGCSDFRGVLTARAAGKDHQFHFIWDCAWKARVAGYTTFWGDPDQQRAAREFGWQCFERFDPMP
jgi:hypothetical protein